MAATKDFRSAWILLLLLNGSNYGYELRRALSDRALRLDPAVMYRTLRDMEAAGFIASRWTRSEAGPRRHVYDITKAGRTELVRFATAISDARDAHSTFLDAFEHATAGRKN